MNDNPNLDDLPRTELIALLNTRADVRGALPPESSDATATRGVAQFSAVYDVVATAIVETDLDYRIVRCNAAFAAMVGTPAREIVGRPGWDFRVITSANPALGVMLGCPSDDLIGISVAELSDPAGTATIEANIRDLVRSGEPRSAKRRYLSSDGTRVPVHVSAAVLHDENQRRSRSPTHSGSRCGPINWPSWSTA